ncbi:hypothetical protein [Lentilactobacillus sp. SPB1-3]|uniref:Uncharacterized protein n=1 Tax=Lentilactobacillus terminaliae TaxID=3003483 RepID=A0ACD5DH45_9LACO|nr:hypothetical protein [Lentilactobacillus sp. SPB1-3]MCZ0976976.1 hypothetical protein [Lentilactobacillus sp. SPB1-3]
MKKFALMSVGIMSMSMVMTTVQPVLADTIYPVANSAEQDNLTVRWDNYYFIDNTDGTREEVDHKPTDSSIKTRMGAKVSPVSKDNNGWILLTQEPITVTKVEGRFAVVRRDLTLPHAKITLKLVDESGQEIAKPIVLTKGRINGKIILPEQTNISGYTLINQEELPTKIDSSEKELTLVYRSSEDKGTNDSDTNVNDDQSTGKNSDNDNDQASHDNGSKDEGTQPTDNSETVDEGNHADDTKETVAEGTQADDAKETVTEGTQADDTKETVTEGTQADDTKETVTEGTQADDAKETVTEGTQSDDTKETVTEDTQVDGNKQTVDEGTQAEAINGDKKDSATQTDLNNSTQDHTVQTDNNSSQIISTNANISNQPAKNNIDYRIVGKTTQGQVLFNRVVNSTAQGNHFSFNIPGYNLVATEFRNQELNLIYAPKSINVLITALDERGKMLHQLKFTSTVGSHFSYTPNKIAGYRTLDGSIEMTIMDNDLVEYQVHYEKLKKGKAKVKKTSRMNKKSKKSNKKNGRRVKRSSKKTVKKMVKKSNKKNKAKIHKNNKKHGMTKRVKTNRHRSR